MKNWTTFGAIQIKTTQNQSLMSFSAGAKTFESSNLVNKECYINQT